MKALPALLRVLVVAAALAIPWTQQQIDALVQEIAVLKDRLRAAAPSPVGPLEDEKPPPHY